MAGETVAHRDKGPIKVTLLMASFGYREADPDDIEFMTLIAQVEQRNAVVIDVDGDNNWLDIYGFTKTHITKAIDAIRSPLRLEVGGAKVWHPIILMGPVKVGQKGFKALLDVSPEGARPRMSPKAGPVTTDAEYKRLCLKWLDEFREKLFQAAKQMRASPSEMRMRITLGVLYLQEWKKNTTEYTYGELEAVIKRLGVRGTFSFSEMLGTAQLGHNLLARIYASPHYFEPVNTRIGKLQNIKPKHTLILTTGSLKVETEVIHVKDTDSSKGVLRLGTAKGFRRERRSRAVEIATSCPEHRYDWNLAVQTRIPVASLPFSRDDIARHSNFSRRPDPTEFPDFAVRPEFVRQHQVERVTGETSWIFHIKGSIYAIEVSVYRLLAEVDEEQAKRYAQGGCGVEFFKPGWDEMLAARNTAGGGREWSENFKELFPLVEKKLNDKDGVEAFIRRVAEIHELVSDLAGNPPTMRTAEVVVPQSKPQEEEEDLLLSW